MLFPFVIVVPWSLVVPLIQVYEGVPPIVAFHFSLNTDIAELALPLAEAREIEVSRMRLLFSTPLYEVQFFKFNIHVSVEIPDLLLSIAHLGELL